MSKSLILSCLLLLGCNDPCKGRGRHVKDPECARECRLSAVRGGAHPYSAIAQACVEGLCGGWVCNE